MSEYAITQCSPSLTLTLSKELVDYGVDVNTPVYSKVVRLPRGRPRRRLTKPRLPGFLFVPRGQLRAALHYSDSYQLSSKLRPMFVRGEVPTVTAAQIALIGEPEKRRPTVGSQVEITSGAFIGVSGVISGVGPHYVYVRSKEFPGTLKIPPFLIKITKV